MAENNPAQLRQCDVVYICKQSDNNEELRYSLRSVAKHFPHRQVVIAGYKPKWVKNVVYIRNHQYSNKYGNARENIKLACKDFGVSPDFHLFNDDFFVLKPLEVLPQWHRGSLGQMVKTFEREVGKSKYHGGMVLTLATLEKLGIAKGSKSYSLHIPMRLNKQKWLEMHEQLKLGDQRMGGIHIRTLYGNIYKLGGTRRKDVKIQDFEKTIPAGADFISTSDASFATGPVGEQLRSLFPEKCVYEV